MYLLRALLLLAVLLVSAAGQQEVSAQDAPAFRRAYEELERMLNSADSVDVARAAFVVEDAWYGGAHLDYDAYRARIRELAAGCRTLVKARGLAGYRTAGNWAIFAVMTDTTAGRRRRYAYNFEDFLGHDDYASVFLTRLIASGQGNCVSLPLLYKVVADELGVEARLTLGPSHVWIRHIDERGGD